MKTYLVKQGESLWQIAKEQRITLEALLASNPQISDINAVLAGEELNLPELAPPPSHPYVREATADYQPFSTQPPSNRPFAREAAADYQPFNAQMQAEPQEESYWPQEPQQQQPQQQQQQQQPQQQQSQKLQPQQQQRPGFCPYCGAPLRTPRPFRRY